MKHTGIIYFLLALIILGFGIFMMVEGQGKLWCNILITLIGLYYLYRGIARTHNDRIHREQDNIDSGDDPANA